MLLAAGLGGAASIAARRSSSPPDPERGWDPADYGIPAEAWEEHWIDTPDGEQLHAWYCRAEESGGQRVFCHGNTGNLTVSADIIPHLLRRGSQRALLRLSRLRQEQRNAVVRGVLDDGVTAARFHDTIRPRDLPSILYGFSLGGAVAAQVIRRHPFDGLILQSTFTNLPAITRVAASARAAALAGRQSLRHARTRAEAEGAAAGPARHGRRSDPLLDGARALRARATTAKRIHIIEGGLHKDLYVRDARRARLGDLAVPRRTAASHARLSARAAVEGSTNGSTQRCAACGAASAQVREKPA